MYSWGDDTSVWKKPDAYDYGDAKKGYLDDLAKKSLEAGERSYTKKGSMKKGPKLELVDPKGRTISTESTNPILVAVDGTASMQKWPAEIFDRLPLMYQTLSKYRDDVEVSFSVIGDAVSDQWPAQISNFGKELALDDYLKALYPEGGGGPGVRESYELWGYFVSEHVLTPKAKQPFLFIMGDELFYKDVKPEQVKHYLGDDLVQPANATDMWRKMGERFNIYLLRKPYPGYDEKVTQAWAEAIGQQKIIIADDATRVVDQAIGIVAKTWGQYSLDFKKSMSARQDDDIVAKVDASLKAVPEADMAASPYKSGGTSSVKKSKKLA